MSYDDDINIDETALDVENLDQARRMRDYCKIAAETKRSASLAEENVKFVRATIERAVRLEPASYGVTPGVRGITEDSIKAATEVHPEYRQAVKDRIDAEFEHDVAVGVVRAFDHRKSSLENLVKLHGQSYFAGPAVPRELPAERALRDRAAQRRIRMSAVDGLEMMARAESGQKVSLPEQVRASTRAMMDEADKTIARRMRRGS